MFAFLNDLSISPEGLVIEDNWTLINQIIQVASGLSEFKIEKIKAPKSIATTPIAGSYPLSHYINLGNGDPRALSVLNLLSNKVDYSIEAIEKALEKEFESKTALGDIRVNGASSNILTGAYLTHLPALSFSTLDIYNQDFLDVVYVLHYLDGRTTEVNGQLENISNAHQIENIHHDYLINVKKNSSFGPQRWDPLIHPIWNNTTSTLLRKLEFPLSVKLLKDKKSELEQVGILIAQLNGWVFDEDVTKLNNRGQLRTIFRSQNSRRTCYLSIDFENAYGRFELHDHKGRHEREIDFETGRLTGERDDKGYHDIKIKK